MSYIGNELDNCPPSSAKNVPGTYFRFVTDTLEKAFKSRFELGIHPSDTCEERALSLVPSQKGIEAKRKRHKAFRESKVAKVNIGTEHGVLVIDKPDIHANWWHPIAFNPMEIASIDDSF